MGGNTPKTKRYTPPYYLSAKYVNTIASDQTVDRHKYFMTILLGDVEKNLECVQKKGSL